MKNKMKILITLTFMFIFGSAFAQPGIVVNSVSGQAGNNVTVNLDYLSDGLDQNLQLDLTYDPAILSVVSCTGTAMNTVGGSVTATCANPGPVGANTVRFLTVNLTGNINAGTQQMGQVVFTINAAAVPGTTPLTLSGVGFAPSGADGVGTGNADGMVTIVAISPQYTSAPPAGTALALGQILQGGVNPATSIDISNTGDATTTLTGTCLTGTANFIVTGGMFSVAEGAAVPPATVGVECDAAAAPGVYNDILTCTHDGSNVPNPATYALSCEVLAAAAAGDQNPPNGTTLNILVSPGGSGTTSVVFSETGGQGVDITDLTCVITPGIGFALTAPVAGATIPAGGTFPVGVTFTDPGDGSATPGSLDCTYTDGTGAVAVSYPLTFAIRAINVPALSMMGYIALTLGFGLIGFFAFRRRA